MSKIDDVLPLPERVEIRLICPDILCVRQIIPSWRDELISVAEKIGGWEQSEQINSKDGGSYKGARRTSRSMMISHTRTDFGPCLRRFELGLLNAYSTGIKAYAAYNPKLEVTNDSGYELLRYHKGERFSLHCDAIVGRYEGFRQVSGMIYLNDDYTGGETAFPRQGVKFKAKAGDLLLFPSNFCYPHESLPVTSGTKYAIVTWFIAHPKLPEQQKEDGHGESNVAGTDSEPDALDERVRLHGSAGSGPAEGEPEASDREHSTSIGGGVG